MIVWIPTLDFFFFTVWIKEVLLPNISQEGYFWVIVVVTAGDVFTIQNYSYTAFTRIEIV